MTTNTIQGEFQKFHRDNRWIYNLLVKYATELKSAGYTSYSIKGLWEYLRFNQAVSSNRVRLNNNYTSRYARLVMRNEPELKGFFKLRNLEAA